MSWTFRSASPEKGYLLAKNKQGWSDSKIMDAMVTIPKS